MKPVTKAKLSFIPEKEKILIDEMSYRYPSPIDVYWDYDGENIRGVYTTEDSGDWFFYILMADPNEEYAYNRTFSLPIVALDNGSSIAEEYKTRVDTEDSGAGQGTAQKSKSIPDSKVVFKGFFNLDLLNSNDSEVVED